MQEHEHGSSTRENSALEHSAWKVFLVFLRLGLTSFGGPVAHLGYFRSEVVERRRWMTDKEYADLVTLCQFLPGPASSQVGFGIGLRRAGFRGALAAFVAFTLPSALIMLFFAYGASLFTGAVGEGILTGLKIVAVAIVAQAVLGMARSLAPDKERAAIVAVAAAAALLLPGSLGQITAIVFGAAAGIMFLRSTPTTEVSSSADSTQSDSASAPAESDKAVSAGPNIALTSGSHKHPIGRRIGFVCLAAFVILLFGLPIFAAATASESLTLVEAFYRAGALVFGGGHVVLPLLQASLVEPGWVTAPDFLAGYGAAQAVPGPLFTFAAFLGATSTVGPGGALGATLALLAVFLPGFLLLVGVLPFWNEVQHRPAMQSLMRGANAAVVGILGAALYSPVFTSSITSPGSFTLALACFVLLISWKLPPWVVVIIGAAGGVLLAVI